MKNGYFQSYHQQFVTGWGLLKGTKFDNDPQLQYLFVKGLAGACRIKSWRQSLQPFQKQLKKCGRITGSPDPRLR